MRSLAGARVTFSELTADVDCARVTMRSIEVNRRAQCSSQSEVTICAVTMATRRQGSAKCSCSKCTSLHGSCDFKTYR